tara:strand:+ start:8026 stop:8952 length:927 start_codon:yes stop_codon:yes gene_type:complete
MKSGFGRGLSRRSVRTEIAANATSETRVLQLITANASSLSADQTAALNNVSLGDITDFTGTLNNYWQFGIPDKQRTGASHAVTTYTPSSNGLTMVTSHADTKFNGSGVAKPVGFWRMIHSPNFDIAIDIDQIANQTSYHSDEWHVHLAVCVGSSFRHNSMFAARLENKGGDWTCARVIKPSYQEQWTGGYIDSMDEGLTSFDASSPPTYVRLRIQHSNADSGYKAYYQTNHGSAYTTLEDGGSTTHPGGVTGGTGFFQMHTKDSNVGGMYNRYAAGGPHCVIVAVGRNNSQTSSSNQGSCRVRFKDLS